MGGSQYIPSFSLSSFAQAVSSPYTSLNAYRSGAIDEQGNLLKPESSIDDFEYFIIKLKKIFDQVPMSYTRSALDSYATTFKMFTEDAEKHGMKPYEFMFFVEGYLTTLLTEDMTTGTAPGTLGTPAQATSEGGVMGYEKVLGAPPAPFMGGIHMFDVSKEDLENFKTHKAWKHIPDSETKKYLQRFQRRNKDSKIAIRALNPENGKHEVHWVKMKPISFMEEFNLTNLSILQEQNAVVSAYKDSVLDDQENVATRKNSEEGIEVTPVEFTGQTFKDTVDILRGELEATKQSQIERIKKRMSERGQKIDAEKVEKKVTFDAPTAELQAQGRKLFRSIPDLLSASQAGKEPEIAQYHGLVRSLLPRSTSSKMPFDVAGFGFSPDTGETSIEKLDIKNPKGTGPVGLKRFQSVLDKMPKINGRAAWEEQADLMKQGRTVEAKKIQDTIINPWFNSQTTQDELAPIWTEKHAEKLRTTGTSFGVFPDPSKEIALVTPGQLANMAGRGLRYRLASSDETYYPLAQTRYGVGRLITPEKVRPPTPEEERGLGRLTGGQVNQNFKDFIRRMINPG
jgi:hypothetical protein